MSEIRVIEKPEEISFEVIWELLHKAHQINFDRGIVLGTMKYSVEEMENAVRDNNGKTFVAMDGAKVVGTCSCWVGQKMSWYHKGPVMKWMLVGVLPEYKGRRIVARLVEAVETEAKARNIDLLYYDSAVKNIEMLKATKRMGFVPVYSFKPKTSNYSSVGMVKWLNGCPYSSLYRIYRYRKKRAAVEMVKWLNGRPNSSFYRIYKSYKDRKKRAERERERRKSLRQG